MLFQPHMQLFFFIFMEHTTNLVKLNVKILGENNKY